MWWFKEKVGICEWKESVCFASKFTLRKKGETLRMDSWMTFDPWQTILFTAL